MNNFRFRVQPISFEADSVEEALAKFSATLWFPGTIFAQEHYGPKNIGDEVNLRILTPEGLACDL